jgi:electron-transferring-flavoprotein dehydrogenase
MSVTTVTTAAVAAGVLRVSSRASRAVAAAASAAAAACGRAAVARRALSSASLVARDADESAPQQLPAREAMEFDLVVVGGGPAGLVAAIRAKQAAAAAGKEVNVCVIEKAAELGGHSLAGAVIEPRVLDEVLPEWRSWAGTDKEAPLRTEARDDAFYFLTESSSVRLPTPPQMHNAGNYIVSLSEVVRWLGARAEEAGVEVYTGFAGSELLYDESGKRVVGVATGDVGVGRDGKPLDTFQRGMELRAPVTLLGEGCRGSLSKQLIARFDLMRGRMQTYGLGVKEVWTVPKELHSEGRVVHTIGWPMDMRTYGGSFLYHMDRNMISVGYVVGLDYQNPYLSPYQEFQRFKHHPLHRHLFENGECIAYGARTIIEGGHQSLPNSLVVPGAALIGDSAGLVNVPKIKGVHTCMQSGVLAANAAVNEIFGSGSLSAYDEELRSSWVGEELYSVRNMRPSFHYGLLGGLAVSALETYVTRGKLFTLPHHKTDHESLRPASECKPIAYPKPDGKISFDLLTNLQRANTNHEENQPCHLTLKDASVPVAVNLSVYDGPESRYCPAGVYEFVDDGQGGKRLQINAQNCIHCKTCDIKDPTQNINWVTPQGGEGPAYSLT